MSVLLVLTAVALAPATASAARWRHSRAGRVIRAIRDAESRTRFLGYRVESYKLWVFVLSAMMAGVAGALYVPQVGIINPSEFAPINSIEVVIWVAVGGRGTLYGAAAGAVLVNYAKTFFTGALPEVWLYALGDAVRAGHAVSAARARRPDSGPGEGRMNRSIAASTRPRPAIRASVWREMREAARKRAPPQLVGKILYLENLTVSFDGFKALNGLTLYVDPGELRCIIGPNGAGKTTMMDVITGKTRPDAGSAWFGRNIDLLSLSEPRDRAGRHRPEVSEAHRVREADRVREPRAGAGR